jgi:hypothetical protein
MIVCVVLCSATRTVGQQACHPALELIAARTSEVHDWKRVWTGVLALDASRCSTSSGQFEIQFNRLMEFGPDLQFSQRFVWNVGQTEVSLDLGWEEWLQDYRVSSIATCPCRN